MKLNKSGQVLVLFVILLPLIILLFAFVVDIGLIRTKANKIENITRMVIKDELKTGSPNANRIKKVLTKNGIPTENIEITYDSAKLNIKNTTQVNSIFGKIININSYDIKINLTGYIKDNKILIE